MKLILDHGIDYAVMQAWRPADLNSKAIGLEPASAYAGAWRRGSIRHQLFLIFGQVLLERGTRRAEKPLTNTLSLWSMFKAADQILKNIGEPPLLSEAIYFN